jgi:hypothetical protein
MGVQSSRSAIQRLRVVESLQGFLLCATADSITLGSPVGAVTLWVLPSMRQTQLVLSCVHAIACIAVEPPPCHSPGCWNATTLPCWASCSYEDAYHMLTHPSAAVLSCIMHNNHCQRNNRQGAAAAAGRLWCAAPQRVQRRAVGPHTRAALRAGRRTHFLQAGPGAQQQQQQQC